MGWLGWGWAEAQGESGAFLLLFTLHFLIFLKLFCFSYFRPLRHFAEMLVHHQYYRKNLFHMMNILVFMFEHFEFHS